MCEGNMLTNFIIIIYIGTKVQTPKLVKAEKSIKLSNTYFKNSFALYKKIIIYVANSARTIAESIFFLIEKIKYPN